VLRSEAEGHAAAPGGPGGGGAPLGRATSRAERVHVRPGQEGCSQRHQPGGRGRPRVLDAPRLRAHGRPQPDRREGAGRTTPAADRASGPAAGYASESRPRRRRTTAPDAAGGPGWPSPIRAEDLLSHGLPGDAQDPGELGVGDTGSGGRHDGASELPASVPDTAHPPLDPSEVLRALRRRVALQLELASDRRDRRRRGRRGPDRRRRGHRGRRRWGPLGLAAGAPLGPVHSDNRTCQDDNRSCQDR
jgi:hypothetical protein